MSIVVLKVILLNISPGNFGFWRLYISATAVLFMFYKRLNMGPKNRSNMVHKPLAPMSESNTWV
jgi:hypothetical protein